MLRIKRIENEYQQIVSNPPLCWKVIKRGEGDWDIWVTADKSCPFWGVPFLVKVSFPAEYPLQKPTIKIEQYQLFFHPNISPFDGSICEKTIKSDSPTTKFRDRIDGFIHVLSYPNPDSPLNSAAAILYNQGVELYSRKAFKIFRKLESK